MNRSIEPTHTHAHLIYYSLFINNINPFKIESSILRLIFFFCYLFLVFFFILLKKLLFRKKIFEKETTTKT